MSSPARALSADFDLPVDRSTEGDEDGGEGSHVRIPPMSDGRWWEMTSPLLAFIASRKNGRDWEELAAWARKEHVRGEMLRQLLAALEHLGCAVTQGWDVKLRWVIYPRKVRGSRRAA